MATDSLTVATVYKDAKQAIGALAQSMSVKAEQLWEILVRQQMVSSVTMIIMFIISLISIFFWFKAYRNPKEEWTDRGNGTFIGFVRIFQIVLSSLSFIILFCSIDSIVTGFMNPEYGALEDIVDMISSMKNGNCH